MDDLGDGVLLHDRTHEVAVAGVAFHERHVGRYRPAEPGGQIVDHDDALATVLELVDHVAADISGTASDEDGHGKDSLDSVMPFYSMEDELFGEGVHHEAAALRPVGDQGGELLGEAERRAVDHLAAGEAGGLEGIEHPGACWIAAVVPREFHSVLVAGKEGDQRHPFVQRWQERMRFQDELSRGDAADALQADERVAHVIENAGAEHEIETPDRLGRQVVHVHSAVLDLAVEVLAGEQEAVEGAMIPGIGIDRRDAGAAALELEREVAVPRANIEHRLAGEIVGDLQQTQPSAKAPLHMPRSRYQAAAEIDRGMETRLERVHARPQIGWIRHHGLLMARQSPRIRRASLSRKLPTRLPRLRRTFMKPASTK